MVNFMLHIICPTFESFSKGRKKGRQGKGETELQEYCYELNYSRFPLEMSWFGFSVSARCGLNILFTIFSDQATKQH